MLSTRRFLSTSGSAIAVSVTIGLSGMTAGALAARGLHPTGRGELVALTVWPLLLMTAATLGTDEAAVFALARRLIGPRDFRRTACRLSWTAGVALSFILFFLQLALVDSRSVYNVMASALVAANVPFFVLLRWILALLRGTNRLARWNLLAPVGSLGYAVMIAVAWFTSHVTVLLVIGSLLVSNAFACLVGVLLTGSDRGGQVHVGQFTQLLPFGLRAQMGTIGLQFNQRLDQALLLFFVPRVSLGLYVVAATIALSPGVLLLSFASWVYARLAQYEPYSDEFRSAAGRYAVIGFVFAGLIYAPVVAFTPQIIHPVFGDAYIGATGVARLLCVGALFLLGSQPLGASFLADGRPGIVARSQAYALCMTVVGLAALAPRFGTAGAAVTSLVAYGTAWLYLLWRFCFRVPINEIRRGR